MEMISLPIISYADLSSSSSAMAQLKNKEQRTKNPPRQTPSVKRWCFTLNNPTEEECLDTDLVEYLIVGDEVGKEGTRHFQGYVQFKEAKRLTGVSKLLPRAHWESAKGTPWDNFVYCSKDGKFKEHGTRPKPTKKQALSETDQAYKEAMAAPTVVEGMDVVKEKRPRDYCMHGETIERNLKRQKIQPFEHVYTVFNMEKQSLEKSLLFYGDSNTGKTHFACSHFKNPLFVSHMDGLKQLTLEHDGIVFDDMSFKHWPQESVIHLLDQEFKRDINVRYGTVSIPARTPKIFTHNTSNPFYTDQTPQDQIDAIERRLERVYILKPLYLKKK